MVDKSLIISEVVKAKQIIKNTLMMKNKPPLTGGLFLFRIED
jgi:hypothetical protein